MSIDLKNVRAIIKWPVPQSIDDMHSFHGLATFYHRFIKGFSIIGAEIYEAPEEDARVGDTSRAPGGSAYKKPARDGPGESTPILKSILSQQY